MSNLNELLSGAEFKVDVTAIEKHLAEMWRVEGSDAEEAVTRAALWNVVAHTDNDREKQIASETLARVSGAVPQRTIVIRAAPAAESEIHSWISANCHIMGGGKQVCSEEITIIAGGERVHHVPPLVNALLIADMPVAAWWLGDLPSEQENYVITLLDPVDRLIVDSLHFNSIDDVRLLVKVSLGTNTSPADLNWVRLDEWRVATASIFDPPVMRGRLRAIRSVRVISAISEEDFFGERIEALYYASWLSAQLGHKIDREGSVYGSEGKIEYRFERRRQHNDAGSIVFVEIHFDDGTSASIERDAGSLKANVSGAGTTATVTRCQTRQTADLIVRQLSPTHDDVLFTKALPLAAMLAKQLR